jgi:hypothetical protein
MPYTYLLGWSIQGKYYYGVRYSKGCDITEIGNTYFSSSKYVKQFIAENGLPNIVEVRKVFNTKESAILWEHKVLRRLKVIKDTKWINRTDNKAINGDAAAYSKASKKKWDDTAYAKKVSSGVKNKWLDKEWADKRNRTAKETWALKRKNDAMPKIVRTEEQKERYRAAALRRWESKEKRQQQSIAVSKSWLVRDKAAKNISKLPH